MSVHIALAQLNFIVGDIEGNTQKIIDTSKDQKEKGIDILLFPELCLTGYPPEDLLLREECSQRVGASILRLKKEVEGIVIIIGFPDYRNGKRFNMAAAIYNGEILIEYRKRELPNYGVFDEKRYFSSGTEVSIFQFKGLVFSLAICEDVWFDKPIAEAASAGAQVILNLNGSPFISGRSNQRKNAVSRLAKKHSVNIVYVNQVGGQDELVFDGGSFVVDKFGKFQCECEQFVESVSDLTISDSEEWSGGSISENLENEEEIYKALVIGVRDYVKKSGFEGVVIGLSGGIDSALTLAIAVDAIGANNVEVVLMPSRYTLKISNEDALEQAKLLNVKHHLIPIEEAFSAFLSMLKDTFSDLPPDVTEENIQSRCRGLILMALSNKTGKMLLTTGNKSEMSVGYATLYGDMNGGFAPLKDVPKLLVYKLSAWLNKNRKIIPKRVIERPPSAELRFDQKDTDTLPDYEILDPIVRLYVEEDKSINDIVKEGFELKIVQKIIRLIDNSEYKRRQAPPGIKITQRAYGRDRRYPIVNAF